MTVQSEWLGKFEQSEPRPQTTVQSEWLGKFAPRGLGERVNIPLNFLRHAAPLTHKFGVISIVAEQHCLECVNIFFEMRCFLEQVSFF